MATTEKTEKQLLQAPQLPNVVQGDGRYLMFEWTGNHFYASSSVECIPLGTTNANGLTTFKINQYGNQVDLTGITITAYREEII